MSSFFLLKLEQTTCVVTFIIQILYGITHSYGDKNKFEFFSQYDLHITLYFIATMGIFSKHKFLVVFTFLGLLNSTLIAIRILFHVESLIWSSFPLICSPQDFSSNRPSCMAKDMGLSLIVVLWTGLLSSASLLCSIRLLNTVRKEEKERINLPLVNFGNTTISSQSEESI